MNIENGRVSTDATVEQRFELLVTSVSDYAIYMLTLDGFVNSWNAGAQRFKGYVAAEIIGQHFSVFYTNEDRAAGKPARALRIALEEGKFEDEGWRVRKDGTHFWASVVVDSIRRADGELVGFAKITRDITERKVAEEALRQSEDRFRRLVQGVTDYAIYMLSPTGEITNWNAGAERIKGYKLDEVIGTHFSRFYTQADREKDLPARALAIAASEGKFEQEGLRVRKDGSTFVEHVVVDPIYGDDGTLIGFAKITRDVTERMQAAEGEQLRSELGAARHARLCLTYMLLSMRHPDHVLPEQLKIAANYLQEIVEIVCDTARQLADCFHLLGLRKRCVDARKRFGRLHSLSHVSCDLGKPD